MYETGRRRRPLQSVQNVQSRPSPPKVQQQLNETPAKRNERLLKSSRLCSTPPATVKDSTHRVYQRGECIGEGGFARCFVVHDAMGRQFAMKTVAKKSVSSQKSRSKLVGEINVHQKMRHPNIVRFYDCFEDEFNCYIVLEICSRRSLMELLRTRKRLTEAEARYFLLQILGAVKYMHGRKVIHRDLKLGNLFLNEDMHVKVGDFGLAALLLTDDERKKTICGTPNYIAPEVLFDKQNGHSFQVDLWSIGVIMYAMLVGKPPFAAKDIDVIYQRIKDNEYAFPSDLKIPESARNLIQDLLSQNPCDRPSLDEIADHAFFHTGIMPRYIPTSALEVAPSWPDYGQSVFKSNWDHVATAAGVGPYSGSGADIALGVGKSVKPLKVSEAKVEDNIDARILPKSISPRGIVRRLKNPPVREAAPPYHQQMPLRPSSLRHVHNAGETPAKENVERADAENPTATSKGHYFSEPVTGSSTRSLRSSIKTVIEHLDKGFQTKLRQCSENLKIEGNFISKWVDYSNRYGLGYTLSDGSTGVYFNDSTSMVLSPNEYHVDYVSIINSDALLGRQSFNIDEYPEPLSKKMYLLKHFQRYMKSNLYRAEGEAGVDGLKTKGMTFMTNYLRTKRAIMFRLSNGDIQFNFEDHLKFLLSAKGLMVQVIDKDRNLHQWSLPEALQRVLGRDRVFERLRYMYDQLVIWLEKTAK